MDADRDMLGTYVRDRSEPAFARLVERHLGMVYSACRRMLGDAHAAEDAVQAVFILLAQKAAMLKPGVVLAGWLHNTARYVCSNMKRVEGARRRHEMKAAGQRPTSTSEDHPIDEAEVDAALGRLGDADRDAVVLRFFQGLSFRDVGVALGISEEAARKRTERGLDRLRDFLAPGATTAAVAGALTAGMFAVPPALAGTTVAAAIGGGAKVVAALPLMKGLAMSAAAKNSVAAVAVAAFLLGIGGGVALTVMWQEPKPRVPDTFAVATQPVRPATGNTVMTGAFDDGPAAVPLPQPLPDYIPNGTMPVFAPFKNPNPEVFHTLHAELADGADGPERVAPGMSGLADGAWLCFRNVDLSAGPTHFVARASVPPGLWGRVIEVRLDDPKGAVVASLRLDEPQTAAVPAARQFTTHMAPVSGLTGKHDVYLTFSGAGEIGILDWVKFLRLPRKADGRIDVWTYDALDGIRDHSAFFSNIDRGDLVRYSAVDFGDGGVTTFEANIGVRDDYAGRTINVRLDSPTGPIIASLTTTGTGAWNKHAVQSAPVLGNPAGVRDVYLTFVGNGVGDLVWIGFKK
jgi:RNA polymerase sigma factor (sigma-70 family)